MLLARPTKNAAGILVYGDYYDLRALHSTIHELVQGSTPHADCGDFVLELAYDLRKAYETFRETIELGYDEIDKIAYRGVRILWPRFLMQVALLRWVAAFQTTNRSQQADLYRLEECAEAALESCDAQIGGQAFQWVTGFPGVHDDYPLFFVVESADRKYVSSSTGRKARFRQLPSILATMGPGTPEYFAFEAQMKRRAEELNCKPSDLSFKEDFPEFKW